MAEIVPVLELAAQQERQELVKDYDPTGFERAQQEASVIAVPDLVGREAELAALGAVVRLEVPAMTLHGDPGVGKSTLLEWGADHARQLGVRPFGAVGVQAEADLPYGGLHQMFAPFTGYLKRLEPLHREALRHVLGLAGGRPPERLVASTASLALLQAAADDGQLLLTVDDLHWIDAPTREVLMFMLLRQQCWRGFGAILARRSFTVAEDPPGYLNPLRVGPLAAGADGELLRRRCPDLPARQARQALREAAGNPRALTARAELEAAFAERVTALPAGPRAALLRMALGGDDHGELTPEESAVLEELELITRGPVAGTARFRHRLARTAALGAATERELRAARAALARSYLEPAERELWDPRQHGDRSKEQAAADLERAALAIEARGATQLAVTGLRQAAALTRVPRHAARRLHDAADLAAECADAPLAERLLAQARAWLRAPEEPGRAQLTRAYLLLHRAGDLTAARRMLLRHAEHCGDPAERAEALRLLITCACYRQEPGDWQDIADLLRRYASQLAPDVQLLYDACSARSAGGPATRDRMLDALHTLETGPGDATARRIAELCLVAFRVDALAEAGPQLRALTGRARGVGGVIPAMTGLLLTGYQHYLAGQWDLAHDCAERGLDLAERHELELSANDFCCLLGRVAAGRGDTETVRELSRGIEEWATAHDSGLHLALSARNMALAAIADGDYETAYLQATRISPAGRLPGPAATAPWAVFDLVEAATRIGQTEEAAACAAAVAEAGSGYVPPRLRVELAAARALTASDDVAIPMLHDALALPGARRRPFDAARIELALGERYRRTRQPSAARPHLRRAADLFTRLGAGPWTQRAEQGLRAAGTAIAARGAEPGGAVRAGLTAQELDIARLAASGLSNREIGTRLFLSPRTVASHLYHVFPKLGITSRVSLRDALTMLTDAG
jgi:DNA-binding CsgD family transcriptional regulator